MAGGGTTASGFGGFGRGLANALLMNRERSDHKRREDQAKADRAFQYQLPVLMKLGEETGDWSPLEQQFAQMFPEQAKAWKKTGSPFTQLAPALLGKGSQQAPQDRTAMEQEQDSAILAGNPAATPQLSNRAQPGQGALQPARKTLFGVELPTDDERVARGVNMQTTQMGLRRKAYQQLIDQGVPQQEAWAMAGLPEMSASANQTQRNTVLNPDDILVDSTGKEIAAGRTKAPTTGTPSDFDEGLGRYMASIGKPGQPASSQDELAYRKQVAESTRAPQAGADGTDVSALARMVARAPALLNSTTFGTPGQKHAIVAAIAGDPELQAQYEAARMAPIRAQSQQVLTTLKDLVQTDAAGNVVALTPGAAALYGRGIGRLSRFNPGSDAANAKAALDQVTGALTLNIINEMKMQSSTGATGFGAMNLQELGILESAATVLKGEISEQRALQEFKSLYERFGKILQPGVAITPPGRPNAGSSATSAPGTSINLDTPIYIGPDGKPTLTAPGQ